MSWPRAEGPPASPDEASAGDDLRVAVVDGLAFEAQRVPLHAAVPCGASTASVKGRRAAAARAALRVEADMASAPQTHRALPSGARPASCPGHRREVRPLPPAWTSRPAEDEEDEPRPARTCPQADHDAQVFGVFLHDDGGQDLAAQQGGLEAVGEGVEAAVAEHGDLVVEGAAGERELRGQGRVRATSGPPRLGTGGDGSRVAAGQPAPPRRVSGPQGSLRLRSRGRRGPGVTSVKPMRSAFSLSPIRTRSAASAASCLPCFLLCAQTAGNQRPPTLAW